jgi:hypothetical protein
MMYTLTDDEKDRLRAEIEYRVAISHELESSKGKIRSFFSHPAIITIIGGLILASATAWFEYSSAISQQKLLYQQQLLNGQISSVSSFVAKFENDFNTLYNLHLTRIAIKKLKNSSNQSDKQKLKDDLELYKKLVDDHMQNHNIVASILIAQSLFKSNAVYASADKIEQQVARLATHNELSEDEVKEIGKAVYNDMKELIKNMRNEIYVLSPIP